jgi:Spy/CpxP family protein refolding chaperone
MKDINKAIDEIAAAQAQEMKTMAASRQKIRSLLTEEQRVHFDARTAGADRIRAGRRQPDRAGNDNRFRKRIDE